MLRTCRLAHLAFNTKFSVGGTACCSNSVIKGLQDALLLRGL